ncbi:MAG: NAD(P)/FAD-dependent oxidoreductase [Tannerellaceae bacterium]|jgi:protoporphyrinogen oxidase|nr:NAD(P)/FAD-dependent oxidoreductase [Tannerellaceae bacterium]
MSKTAVIIGAGPAGLTAAYQLLKTSNIKPIIVEELDCVGGIARTITYNNNRLDIGPHRFFSKSDDVNNLWHELMPVQGHPSAEDKLLNIEKPLANTEADPDKQDVVWLIRNRLTRIFFVRKFFDYPITIKLQTFTNMGLRRTLKVVAGYIAATIRKRKENSLENFYINRFGKPLYKLFFEDYTEKLWGIHPSNISASWGAQRVKELSLSRAIKEVLAKAFNRNYRSKTTSLIDQFIYPKNGSSELWNVMAKRIIEMGGEIHFNMRVNGIASANNRIEYITATKSDGTTEILRGDFFFSSMPVSDLIRAFDQVPDKIAEISDALPYRDLILVGLTLQKMKITNTTQIQTVGNIIPDCWIYLQEREVKAGRMQITNNLSPYLPDDFRHHVGIGLEYFCNEGDADWNMEPSDFIRFAIADLSGVDIISPADVIDSVHLRVRKAYPAYFGSYSEFYKVQQFLDSFTNLFCIGRNGQHRYNNMDHSMLTAIEAVKLVASGQGDKCTVWNVNTESEYHEEKQ